ncbi:cytochrome D1 domain-containing protein [Marinobacter halophilus]|uniref:Cytochrome C oxidase Cbb3 n=1 Tax=Marinobacter halophilus TaxID=1323740 RepID=A0A2T1KFP4_9GAMM|nr:cytochrome D1 domain-containing protein [Marinobacter halophilus]PSF08947.1 cytochrome C oxidase Cbb3 [Marinobacter halophilus]GGC61039.1 cytochrome c [Marinobacter halophilus]
MNLNQPSIKLSQALLFAAILLAGPAQADDGVDTDSLYLQHCAACHGTDRLGGMGPALLPDNLSRLRKPEAEKVIREGRPATQMAGYQDILNDQQITALTEFMYQAPTHPLVWGLAEIRSSREVSYAKGTLPDEPVFDADLMNLFLVVEIGDHHVTLLDGDKMEPIHRFPSRFALHGGPKYSPDGRYVYFGSRDGWITKYDLYNLKVVAEVRAGINMRNIAVSADGNHLMAANYLPHTLVLFDAANLELLDLIPVANGEGESSRVSAVYAAPPRGSFIAALKDIPEAWEITVEDNRAVIRRMTSDTLLDDFFFDPGYQHLIGAARDGKHGVVINLDTGTTTAELPLPGMPHLGSGITWEHEGRRVMATPHFRAGAISIIDMDTWQVIKTLETEGPGFFMRSHENSRYAWADVFFGPNADKVHIIDKQTLEIVKTLQPEPGKVAAHVEFDRYGKKLLLSIWDDDGAIVVYDADTLEEEKRIPMKKPSGKYNVWNKINYEEGTSH